MSANHHELPMEEGTGSGNLRTVSTLRSLIHKYSPDLVFVVETKLFESQASDLKNKIGMD